MENGKCVFLRLLLRCLLSTRRLSGPPIGAASLAIVEIALHFPALHIELPPCATIEAAPVRLTLAGEWPAHLLVPATKQPVYPVSNRAPRRIVRYEIRFILND